MLRLLFSVGFLSATFYLHAEINTMRYPSEGTPQELQQPVQEGPSEQKFMQEVLQLREKIEQITAQNASQPNTLFGLQEVDRTFIGTALFEGRDSRHVEGVVGLYGVTLGTEITF